MSKNDELFQEDQLEEELEALAQAGNQSPVSFKSRTYQRLKQFHAVWAAEDAQAIERVRQRLAAHAGNYVRQPQSEKRPRHWPLPWPMAGTLPHPVRKSRMHAFAGALVAVLMVGVLVSGFVLLLHSRQAPTSSPAITAGFVSDPSRWHLVASPNVPRANNSLNAISFATGNDAWAVGTSGSTTRTLHNNNIMQATTSVLLTEHWDSRQWKIVSTPRLPGQVSIFAVVDIAPGDAWLVGSIGNASTVEQTTIEHTLIEHWDGQEWRVMASPSPGKAGNRLKSIAALAPNDIWAVGDYTNDRTIFYTLIEHWDGQQWNVVSDQIAGPHEFLTGIAAISPNDIWAVGFFTTERAQSQTLIEHWDGSQWHVISSPSPGFTDNILDGITAISANDVWAIGTYDIVDHNTDKPSNNYGSGSLTKTLVEHWDGQRWRVVPSPNPSPAGTELTSISSLGPNDIWITGVVSKFLPHARPGQPDIIFNELIEHWDGQQWHIVDHSPNPGGFQELSGITRDPSVPGKLWIVGSYGSSIESFDGRTLVETNM